MLPEMEDRPSCMICGRPTYDPHKRERPWARGVRAGRQVLVCPRCQAERDDWQDLLDQCPSCGGTRLTLTLGEVSCRACGHAWSAA
jgi:DNA-directed RNA polymerase subunit RPC12/RpoP